MIYLREEVRVRTKEEVTATILGHPDVTIPCEITNFSRSGMCITVRQEIAAGNAVKVDWGGHFLVGRVRHVSAEGPLYQVGLQLLHCSEWKDGVEPEPAQFSA